MVCASAIWLLIVLCSFAYIGLTTGYFIAFWGDLPVWCVTLECMYAIPIYLSVFTPWAFIQSCAWESNCMDGVVTCGLFLLQTRFVGQFVLTLITVIVSAIWIPFFIANIIVEVDSWYFATLQLILALLILQ